MTRPPIFISAVSKELRSARQLVANTLIFLGYQPVWQDIFGTEGGDLRGLLRQQIDECKGVVQLVGQFYGSEPPIPDEKFGRVSYTQYEALYARERGKKVWYLFIDENFPVDAHEPQPDELRDLQAAYRSRVQSDAHLFHSLASREALEASVLKLRDDLARLRRGAKQWAGGVAILLCLIAAMVVWLVHGQGQAAREIGETKKEMAAVTAEMTKWRLAIMEYARVDAEVRESRSGRDADTTQERVYTELGSQLGLDPKALREKLPQLAEQLKRAPEASSYERANAAYVVGDYLEAERLAMEAVGERRKAVSTKPLEVVQALILAGLSAERGTRYASALEHFRDAEKLTDRKQSPEVWLTVQNQIAVILIYQGHYKDAENVLRRFLEVCTQVLGAEHPNTLVSRRNLANAMARQDKYAEAEAENRALLKLTEKALGPEHPATLNSRALLLSVLSRQGKDTEAEDRALLQLREKVLGSEHPDTMSSRSSLAGTIFMQGNYVEAETEYRTALKMQEKVLGPEHPDTLRTRRNLALTMYKQRRYTDSEAEGRTVLNLKKKVLGPEHPDTLDSQMHLVHVLHAQHKYVEAEAENRAVLKLQEKVLGPEHPETLESQAGLAYCLMSEGKLAEATQFAQSALDGARKTLGPHHPDTKRFGRLCDQIKRQQK